MDSNLIGYTMDSICGVLDIQGYMIGKAFYPREFALVNDTIQMCFLVDHGLKLNAMSYNTRQKLNYQVENLHGLNPFSKMEPCIKSDQLDDFIKQFYEMAKTKDRIYIAVKGYQTFELLNSLKIPVIDYEKICSTPVREMLCGISPCCFHTDTSKIIKRCALRKCKQMWNVICSPQNMLID